MEGGEEDKADKSGMGSTPRLLVESLRNPTRTFRLETNWPQLLPRGVVPVMVQKQMEVEEFHCSQVSGTRALPPSGPPADAKGTKMPPSGHSTAKVQNISVHFLPTSTVHTHPRRRCVHVNNECLNK